MNGRHPAAGIVLVGAMLLVAACGGGGTAAVPIGSGAPVGSAPVPSVTTGSDAPTTPASPTSAASAAAPASKGTIAVSDACALTTPGELADVVGFRFLAGHDVSAETGWTTACAWVQSVAAGESPYNVNVRSLAAGTLTAFAKMAGSTPVAGLADEAYVFDDGRQVAMRFGSVIVLVAGARGLDGNGVPASAVGALARLIASRLRG